MKRTEYIEAVDRLAFSHGKMAFITGPRQVGKTTLAKQLADSHPGNSVYLNWDDPVFRRQWIKNPQDLLKLEIGKRGLAILDEIHKAAKWKNTLKGLYDTQKDHWDMVVTGSARLDIFRRGGDSLLGRYFLFRLHPLSLGELLGEAHRLEDLEKAMESDLSDHSTIIERLMEFSGFPEPYLKKDRAFLNVWQRTRTERLVREDLRDISRAHDFSMIESVAALLPERIGSTLSLNSLREDLEISHPTLKRWLGWLEQIFFLYQLRPYSKKLARSLKKETKPYLWDWSQVESESARFENLVASHLLKACHYSTDTGLANLDLFYLRDKEKREVDFCILRDQKPWMLVECKQGEQALSPSLLYYGELLKPSFSLQIIQEKGIHQKTKTKTKQTVYQISAGKFFSLFP